MQDNSSKMPTQPLDPVQNALSATTSEQAFAMWGIEDVAYIKQIFAHGALMWAIYSADGVSLGAVPDRDLAFAAATQNDRIPLSLH